ncbi:MAG: tRNA-specific 2-thiouridylase MnmA [Candidatus Parcubacteria bacterium]|jgi:tRNA-specific 2-thiouridylase
MAKRVYAAVSGGVDSAVSAALLKAQGHDVTGVFVKIWRPEFLECTWKEDRLDALRVCAALDIPFREVDLSSAYQREVVDAMLADYSRGITPNPDVRCNEKIKFGALLRWALAESADIVATGHYARVEERNDAFALRRAADAAKDQSYFLYRLGQDELAHAMFPVGSLLKSRVRELARRYALPNADRPDSQGLCFVGDVSMRDFLSRYIPLAQGDVVDESGSVVGRHEGAALYTIGQRHGFTAGGGGNEPHYVVGINVEKNVLQVARTRDVAACSRVALSQLRWVGETALSQESLFAQSRYHEEPVEGILSMDASPPVFTFRRPHVVSPGQSLVLYRGDECLGGGIISRENLP